MTQPTVVQQDQAGQSNEIGWSNPAIPTQRDQPQQPNKIDRVYGSIKKIYDMKTQARYSSNTLLL